MRSGPGRCPFPRRWPSLAGPRLERSGARAVSPPGRRTLRCLCWAPSAASCGPVLTTSEIADLPDHDLPDRLRRSGRNPVRRSGRNPVADSAGTPSLPR